MKVQKSLIAVAMFSTLGGAAVAQIGVDAADDELTPRTRAEVNQEARAAVAAGQIPRGEAQAEFPSRFFSTRSRGDVGAQAAAALAAGRIARGEAEFEYPVQFVSTKTRPQVLAEAREAMRLGLIARGDMPLPVATRAQRESIQLAGLRARNVHDTLAAK
jgi:Domain of unknown function (DUF4148)